MRYEETQFRNAKSTCKIWVFHGGDYEESSLLEAIRSSETSVNTTYTRCQIPEDCFLLSPLVLSFIYIECDTIDVWELEVRMLWWIWGGGRYSWLIILLYHGSRSTCVRFLVWYSCSSSSLKLWTSYRRLRRFMFDSFSNMFSYLHYEESSLLGFGTGYMWC
jgi:hypothetical protein